MSVKVIFGSSTGNTESAAAMIAAEFDGAEVVNVANASAETFNSELLILGASTWGVGDIQDDWDGALDMLDSVDYSGKKVAIFGLGDQCGFGDSFVDAIGELYEKVTDNGASVIGFTSSEGYEFDSSTALKDGKFVGLALDEDNQSDLTESRISDWCKQLKTEL